MAKFPDPHRPHKSGASAGHGHPKRRMTRTCGSRSCTKNPYFGWSGGKAIFCVAHKEAGMVDVKNKRCDGAGCQKRRLFGFSWEKARYCSAHRLDGMVDLQNKRCKWAGCPKQAIFALEGKTVAAFCAEHRSAQMVDVKNPRCQTDRCTKVAGYGSRGQAPIACLHHRRPHMVEIKHRRARQAAQTTVPKSDRNTSGVGVGLSFSGGGGGGDDGGEPVTGRGQRHCPGRGGGGGGVGAALFPSREAKADTPSGVYTNDYGGKHWPLSLPPGIAMSKISNNGGGDIGGHLGGDGPPQQRQRLLSPGFASSDGFSSPDTNHPGSPPLSVYFQQEQEHPRQLWTPPPPSPPPAAPTSPIFFRGSASPGTGLTFPPIFNRFGGVQSSGSYPPDAGGSGDTTGVVGKVASPVGLRFSDNTDTEPAPDAWLRDIMREIAAGDADRSAWQEEHRQQQQLDMDLLAASAGATRRLSCRQHQQQQQQQQQQQEHVQQRWLGLRPVSELLFGSARRMK